MERNITWNKKRCLSFLLAALLCMMSFGAVTAETDVTIEYWNATTSLFTATFSGELTGTVSVSLGGETTTAAVITSGGKTTVTAHLADRLSLDMDYTAEIMAGGAKIAEKEFCLQTLWADDFDGYANDAAIREVYKGSNDNAIADLADGAMRIRSMTDVGVVTHKDFSTTQKSWQDYTLEYDYIPGTNLTNNQAATQAFAYIECGAEDPNLKFDALGKSSTAYIYLDHDAKTDTDRMIPHVRKADGNVDQFIWTDVKGVSERSNIQISTRGNKVTFYGEAKNGSGRLAYEKPIPDGIPRGGGFAFVPRGKNFCIDNLKVYKLVEKEPAPVELSVEEWNATTSLLSVTLDGEAAGVLTAETEGRQLTVQKSIAGGKTELKIVPDERFTIGEAYSVRILENGEEAAMQKFKLIQMFADDFDSYESDEEIGKVYIGSNSSAVAEVAEGALRIRTTIDKGTVTHKDFLTEQKNWQDYTLEYDYIPGKAVSGTPAATQAFTFIECNAENPDMMFAELGKSSTAYMYLDNGGSAPTGRMIAYVRKASGNPSEYIWDKVKGVTERSNIQISTKGNKVTFYGEAKNGSGRIALEKPIPEGIPRGGGFAFVPRGKNFCIDNLKVYKAVVPNENRTEMSVENSEFGAKEISLTFTDAPSSAAGSKLTLKQYADGKVAPAQYRTETEQQTLRILPSAAFADGVYELKLASGYTSADDEKELKEDFVRFFRVSGGKVTMVSAWTSDPEYGSITTFDEKITLTFAEALKASTITADSVNVMKNGSRIGSAVPSVSGKTVTILLGEPIEYSSRYEVSFTNQAEFEGDYGFPDLVFFTQNSLELTDFAVTLDGQSIGASTPIGGKTIGVGATLTSYEKTNSRKAVITFCVYDSNGRLCGIGGESLTVSPSGHKDVRTSFTLPKGSGYTIKCFVWDSFDTMVGIHEEIWR